MNEKVSQQQARATFVEQMDMLWEDFSRYEKGDPKVPFVVIRDSLVAALNAYQDARQAIDQHPDTQGAQYEGGYPLRAEVWFRSSTNEWVLQISGTINDTHITCRHTEPATTKPEDVPGLPSRYKPDTQGEPVAWQARMTQGSYTSPWSDWPLDKEREPKIGRWTVEYRPLYAHPSPEQAPDGLRRALEWMADKASSDAQPKVIASESHLGWCQAHEYYADCIRCILAAHPENKHE